MHHPGKNIGTQCPGKAGSDPHHAIMTIQTETAPPSLNNTTGPTIVSPPPDPIGVALRITLADLPGAIGALILAYQDLQRKVAALRQDPVQAGGDVGRVLVGGNQYGHKGAHLTFHGSRVLQQFVPLCEVDPFQWMME
jgi:hypothetical protein